MNIKNVTVFGSGVLGAQIAFQTAYHGCNVILFDIKEELLGVDLGPMAMLDFVEMNTAYNVVTSIAESSGDKVWKRRQDFMKENFIDQNKLGISTGEGFYTYPNPAYQDADFLK